MTEAEKLAAQTMDQIEKCKPENVEDCLINLIRTVAMRGIREAVEMIKHAREIDESDLWQLVYWVETWHWWDKNVLETRDAGCHREKRFWE